VAVQIGEIRNFADVGGFVEDAEGWWVEPAAGAFGDDDGRAHHRVGRGGDDRRRGAATVLRQ
jgi:hypothetical protein